MPEAQADKSVPETVRPETGIDPRYVAGWSRVARAVLGGDRVPAAADPAEFDAETTRVATDEARIQRALAELARVLMDGGSLEDAVRRTVADLARANKWEAAWAVAAGAGRLPGGELAGTVGHAVLLHERGNLDLSWSRLSALDDETLARHLPVEAVTAALAAGTEDARTRAEAVAARTHVLSTGALVDLAGRFLVVGAADVAQRLVAEASARDLDGLGERRRRSLDLVSTWLERPGREVPEGAVPVAVIDYHSPDQDQASGNVGDFIQTLALLGNFARLAGVTYSGEGGLGELVTELQGRVRPDLRVAEPAGRIHLLPVNRDFSSADDIPEDTWLVAFGWHMHPLFGLRYDFPYHPNLQPLFLSFHVNRLEMLTDEALDYLREHGPVGCRDWTTVFLLLSAGVDAFFTGCLTSTVDAVFPRRAEAYEGDGVVGVVDLQAAAAGATGEPVELFTHQADVYRHMSVTEGVHAAMDLLGDYQRRLGRAVTRRLHAYLPLTALGVPAELRPWHKGDVRFAGLVGLEPRSPRLRRMQRGLRELVAETLGAAVGGASVDEVYARWRDLTADLVAEAKERFAEQPETPRTSMDVDAAVAVSRKASRAFGPHDDVDPEQVTDVVLCFDQNLTGQVPVVLESMLSNATGPLRVWLMTRGVGAAYQDWLATAFPTLPLTFLPCDHIDHGTVGRVPDRITISTMDRLLLPVLLDRVDRVVYLDIDTVVLGDVSELGSLDLFGRPLAARDSDVSAFSEWRKVARRLPAKRALEVQRRIGLEHGYDGAALNAGVLVLDLARMRRDDFTCTYLGWVERYGLNDQDVMLAYAGPDRVRLDPSWNALPVLEEVREPRIVHWAGLSKPWGTRLTPHADLWRPYAVRVRDRAGDPPPH